jgi:hypothetical protein
LLWGEFINFNKKPLSKAEISAEIAALNLSKRPHTVKLWLCIPRLMVVCLAFGYYQGLSGEALILWPAIAIVVFFVGQFIVGWGMNILGLGSLLCFASLVLLGKIVSDIFLRFGVEFWLSMAFSAAVVFAVLYWTHLIQKEMNVANSLIDDLSVSDKKASDYILSSKEEMPKDVRVYVEQISDRLLTYSEVQEIYKLIKST